MQFIFNNVKRQLSHDREFFKLYKLTLDWEADDMVSIGCFSEQIVIIILQQLFKVNNGFNIAIAIAVLQSTLGKNCLFAKRDFYLGNHTMLR